MKIDVLDHGYVQFIEAWGTGSTDNQAADGVFPFDPGYEAGIIEAARQSTQGAFRGWDQDEKLLGYLYKNNHATPFEFAGLVIEVQAPIFVFREWHRHRTQSYNEMSARYEPLPDLYYTPEPERLLLDAGKNKQAQSAGGKELTIRQAARWCEMLEEGYAASEGFYQAGLSNGVPKELARLIMPVGHYSRMRASANLRNWLAFLTLRMDNRAQWEIRQYANAVAKLVEGAFPKTWALFKADGAAG